MSTTAMIETHPHTGEVDAGLLARTIDILLLCSTTCSQCADACLAEPGLSHELARCIAMDLDCADICSVTARVVARQSEHPGHLTRAQLEACAVACTSCADECDHHRPHLAHCRICAETCRRCEAACRELLAAIS